MSTAPTPSSSDDAPAVLVEARPGVVRLTLNRPANASTRRTASGCSDAAAIDAASCRTCARSASTSAPRASAFVGP